MCMCRLSARDNLFEMAIISERRVGTFLFSAPFRAAPESLCAVFARLNGSQSSALPS